MEKEDWAVSLLHALLLNEVIKFVVPKSVPPIEAERLDSSKQHLYYMKYNY